MMSLNASDPKWYISGLRNPSGGLPAAMRASFSRATRPANEGAAADVPLADVERPLKKTRKFSACAETSGIACENGTVIRQLVLSPPSMLRWKGLAYASMRIEESRVGVFGQRSEKPLHSGVLIRWPRELSRLPILVSVILEKKKGETHDVAEPPTRKLGRNLRDGGRPANRRHAMGRPKSVRCEQNRNTWTHYGQVAGKFGMN